MTPAQIERFFAILQAANPHPETELEYGSAFELLVAVLLSAQATDAGVNKATRILFPLARTPQQMLDLGLERLEAAIKTIGLYHSKARHLLQTCRILVDEHAGQVPRTRAALDTHIFRVSNRTGLAPGKTPLAVAQKLLERVPPHYLLHAHHWLILHGRYVCQARKPRCWECAVAHLCDWPDKTPAPSKTT